MVTGTNAPATPAHPASRTAPLTRPSWGGNLGLQPGLPEPVSSSGKRTTPAPWGLPELGHTSITCAARPHLPHLRCTQESRHLATPRPPPLPSREQVLGSELRQALARGTGTLGAGWGRVSTVPKAPELPGAHLDVSCTELRPRPLRRGLLRATSDRGSWGCHSASPFLRKLLWRDPGEHGDPLHLPPAIWG